MKGRKRQEESLQEPLSVGEEHVFDSLSRKGAASP